MGVFPFNNGVGMVLGFENEEFGVKILQDWIERFGNTDDNNKIKISIITDIDKQNPHYYQVMFSSKFDNDDVDEDTILITPCRFHFMYATNNGNLRLLKEGFNRFKKFRLFAGSVKEDLQMQVNFEYWIEKNEILFIKKEDIKENDIEYTAITQI
jgi:hypothetical protein